MDEPARDLWQGVRPALVEVVEEGRTGSLKAHSAGDEVGVVVLVDGRLAWATCLYQPEDLGTLLSRLGHVSADHLRAAGAAYDEHQGRKKFGRILEDLGVISQPVLRRCLLLHLRMALTCMMRNEALVVGWSEGNCGAPDDVSFTLEEVMPELMVPAEGSQAGEMPRWPVLEPFSDTPGFRAAVVAEPSGEVLAVRSDSAATSAQMGALGAAMASVLEGSRESSPRDLLGEVSGLVVEGSVGTVVARLLEKDPGAVLAVVLSSEGKVGIAKHRLAAEFDGVQERLRRHRLEQE